MASPTRAPPGVMSPDEAYIRSRCPTARAVTVHSGDGTPPAWQVVEHPTRSPFVFGSGPTEAEAWKNAAAMARGSYLAFIRP